MVEGVVVHGPPGSSYVQSVRLALVEKAIPYELRPVDFRTLKSAAYAVEMHPFGRIPVFDHNDLRLYETQAIIRYIDEAFPGPSLQPTTPRQRARMNQAIGVLENYSLGRIHGGRSLNYYRAFAPRIGAPVDEEAVVRVIPEVRACLAAYDQLLEGPCFCGGQVTLADILVAPTLYVLGLHADGQALLGDHPRLSAWLGALSDRWASSEVLMPP